MTTSFGSGLGLIICVGALLALGNIGPQRGEQKPPETKPPAKRVRVNLAGFELGQTKPPPSSTQLGGGTRALGGGDTTLMAPAIGRSYTATPVFAWAQPSQARTFEFRLFDEAGTQLYRKSVTGRQLAYPADAPALQAGTKYEWSVQPESSMLGGPSARATIVRPPASELEDVSQQLARTAPGVDPQEWKAQVFTDRRFWYDAVAAWSELIDRFPDRADLREKRGQIYDQIPATEALANEDFAAADRLRARGGF